MKKLGLISLAIGLPALLFAGCKLTRAGYESAEYRVLKKDGRFELREYPTLTLASTPMESVDPNKGRSFNRLFGYIQGGNEADQKISMTTPVLITAGPTNRAMNFVVPRQVVGAGVPKGTNEAVQIDSLAGGRFAVYRFSGSWSEVSQEKALTQLRDWMTGQRLEGVGEPVVAFFDPPFTPSFLRRNEVMLRFRE